MGKIQEAVDNLEKALHLMEDIKEMKEEMKRRWSHYHRSAGMLSYRLKKADKCIAHLERAHQLAK